MMRSSSFRALTARRSSSIHTPPPIRTRQLHSSVCLSRDLWAKYHRPKVEPEEGPSTSLLKTIEPTFAPPQITGPRDKHVVVEGIEIPPKPIPPGDEDCCMSGCVHCVLTIYAEDLDEYQTAMDTVKARLENRGVPPSEWPTVMRELEEQKTEKNEPIGDPAMAAFMALEKKLKDK